ncbi:helix-hairpin-helix domain-containing protein [Gaoshiqia sp. Z1-71]|uniref:helix-hairpin-helix domain-containing protein n=1 Tax=Gaoshiqia hydrogeniformans TaxID=3290090 RepID=UPI003BF8511E
MKLNQIIREYFTFNRAERKALIVLIFLIVVFMAGNQLIFYFEKPGVADQEQFERFLDEWAKTKEQPLAESELFRFDPNAIDSLSLARLNLPASVKRNLLRYRSSGGRFKTKEQFRKIYGMTDSVYEAVAGLINLPADEFVVPEKSAARPVTKKETPVRPAVQQEEQSVLFIPAPIEVNQATTDDLKRIRGIGDVLSVRIVKYRDLLGGFYSLDQLGEVYGLKPEMIPVLKTELTLDRQPLKQININFAGLDELAAHPYLRRENAAKVMSYKARNGFIADKISLLEDSVLTEEIYRKISPYLKTKN